MSSITKVRKLSREKAAYYTIKHMENVLEKLSKATQGETLLTEKDFHRLAADLVCEAEHLKWIFSQDNKVYR